MSRPSDAGRVLAALAVLMPVLALSGVTVDAPTSATAARPASAPARQARAEVPAAGAGAYQIRCWQHGRLLFEDRITLPSDAAAYGIRLSGTDRNGKPMYVAETRNATCLVRVAPDERYWPH
jgi:hypothetical protein